MAKWKNWLVCLFHHLKKSFEGSFVFNGFVSNSGTSLAEPWRSLISGDIHKWPIVYFDVIENPSLLCLLDSRNKTLKLSNDPTTKLFWGLLRL